MMDGYEDWLATTTYLVGVELNISRSLAVLTVQDWDCSLRTSFAAGWFPDEAAQVVAQTAPH